ncbi:hypothetical protein [Rhodosalinus sp. 5P4]|uniref:DUF6946 family protein n=1 Tax=Rhodosalinus sp. 5P4 TaxID=3239196 RepID=UPI003524FDB1
MTLDCLHCTCPLSGGRSLRTAAALLEATRFKTLRATMILRSFSREHRWFEDFAIFTGAAWLRSRPWKNAAAHPAHRQTARPWLGDRVGRVPLGFRSFDIRDSPDAAEGTKSHAGTRTPHGQKSNLCPGAA